MDSQFMKEAIRLSEHGMRLNKGGPFGAVVVQRGEIVGRGFNSVTSRNDPTAHAEIVAIRDACRRLKTFSLEGCAIYSSCEPCPMCLAAIYWARLERICYGNTREDAAAIGFDDASFYHELSLPMSKRRLRMKQTMHRQAHASFDAWLKKMDKIGY